MRKVFQRGWVYLVLFSILASGCEIGEKREEKAGIEEEVTTEAEWGNAPDFTLTDLEGNSLTLSQFKGKVIILNFWATWCPPCRREIPDFVELYEKYKDEGLLIIGVSLDRDGKRLVRQFSQEYKIDYPIVFADSKVTRDYGGIRAIPASFIIDKEGSIKEKYVGYQPRATFEEAIKKLLGTI